MPEIEEFEEENYQEEPYCKECGVTESELVWGQKLIDQKVGAPICNYCLDMAKQVKTARQYD